jgi:ribosomal protein S18 acetylase RimI-like enzyme
MTTKQLLRILDNPRWDYTKSFEVLQIGKSYGYPCTYYRYKKSILTSPGAHFFVATKRKYRGKGYAEELIKKVFNITKYMMTTIHCDNKKLIKRLLKRLGFVSNEKGEFIKE